MLHLEVYLLSLCLLLSSSNFLSPEAEAMKITGRNTGQESENDNLDTKHINTMYNTIETFEEYTQFLRNNQDLPKHNNYLDKVEYILTSLKKGLLRHTLTATCQTEGDIQRFNKVIQDVMDILPPLVQEKELELSPELKEAKGLYDAALLTLNRRTPDLYRVVYKVRLPRDMIEYILAKMKLAWSYLTGEGLEWELEIILADLHGAMHQVTQAANIGYVLAKIKLAWSYLFGENIEMNLGKAKVLFEELAADGNAEGHAGLGFLYATGMAVPVSQAKALVHYTMGAIGDSDFAQMALAYRYWSGNTVRMSCPKAMDLYMRVASKVISYVEGAGPGTIDSEILDSDTTSTVEFYRRIGEKRHQEKHAQPDYERDLLYFKEAAKLDNPAAQVRLGLMYLKGRGVPKDPEAAFKYFTMAANQGWAEGQLQLGLMYFNGIGVRRDFEQANKYFSLASQTGHVLALYHLGLMHAQGLGVTHSCVDAVMLFRNVSERGPWATRMVDAHESVYPRGVDSAILQHLELAERGYSSQQRIAAVLLDTSNYRLSNGPELKALYQQLRTRSKVPRQEQSVHPYYRLSRDDSIYSCRAEKELIYAESRV